MTQPLYQFDDGPYTDAYLECWGDVYLRTPTLATARVTFVQFLRCPHFWLDRTEFLRTDLDNRLCLLPAQRAVRDRLDIGAFMDHARRAEAVLDRERAECHNGTWMRSMRRRAPTLLRGKSLFATPPGDRVTAAPSRDFATSIVNKESIK